jgi:hypothetical protein
MMTAANIRYEIAEKVWGIAPGGIGAIHLLARKVGSRPPRQSIPGPCDGWPGD